MRMEFIVLLIIGVMIGVVSTITVSENIKKTSVEESGIDTTEWRSKNWISTSGVIDCPFQNEFIMIFNSDETYYKCERLDDPIKVSYSSDELKIKEIDIERAYSNPYYYEFINELNKNKPDGYRIDKAEIHYHKIFTDTHSWKHKMIQWQFYYEDKPDMMMIKVEKNGLHSCEVSGNELWFTYWENGTSRSVECVDGGINCYYINDGDCLSKDLYDYIKSKENKNDI